MLVKQSEVCRAAVVVVMLHKTTSTRVPRLQILTFELRELSVSSTCACIRRSRQWCPFLSGWLSRYLLNH